MKTGKRLLSLLLAVIMVLSVVPVIAARGAFEKTETWSDALFTDVAELDWFHDNVKGAYELGLMEGQGNGLFAPEGSITLAETVTVAARIHAIYHGGEDFIQGTPWYQVYVDYALANGILKAAPADCSEAATRLEFAEILSRALPESELKAINKVDDGRPLLKRW